MCDLDTEPAFEPATEPATQLDTEPTFEPEYEPLREGSFVKAASVRGWGLPNFSECRLELPPRCDCWPMATVVQGSWSSAGSLVLWFAFCFFCDSATGEPFGTEQVEIGCLAREAIGVLAGWR
jgi:hypothetical protein